mmetsp:Transcript_102367/g.305708  ORF Transcript_102367/g.305708 Transcript_102367/m.305708 type:complete len:307 (+) Transcript_102367:1009-1929(+)
MEAQVALLGRAAVRLVRVPHEEVPHDLVGVDLMGRLAELALHEGIGVRPGVPIPLDHDQDHAGVLHTVVVLVIDHVLGLPHPPAVLALVVGRPLIDSIGHRGMPVGGVSLAPVRVDRIFRSVDGDDRHGPRGVVGVREPKPSNWRNAAHEVGQLGGEPRAEARAPGVARAPDAVHVHAHLLGDVPQDRPGVFHVVRQIRQSSCVEPNVHALDSNALQHGEGKAVRLGKLQHPGHVQEPPGRLVGPRREQPERHSNMRHVGRRHEQEEYAGLALHLDPDMVQATRITGNVELAPPTTRGIILDCSCS